MPQSQAVTRAKLEPFDVDPNLPGLIFTLNPNRVTRTTIPQYAEVNVALADFGRFNPRGGTRPQEWIRNRPEEIRIEYLLAPLALVTTGDEPDVEEHLVLLDKYMQKSTRTGEPVDLIFTMGSRHDYVRIYTKEVEEKLYTPDLRVKHAIVHLTMHTIT